jgi:hypothetical protein
MHIPAVCWVQFIAFIFNEFFASARQLMAGTVPDSAS